MSSDNKQAITIAIENLTNLAVNADNISNFYYNQQKEIADTIVSNINKKLGDPTWLDHERNYRFEESYILRLSFYLFEEMPEPPPDRNRLIPSDPVTRYLTEYYSNKGWTVKYSERDYTLELRNRIEPLRVTL